MSTEPISLIRDREPRTAASTLTQPCVFVFQHEGYLCERAVEDKLKCNGGRNPRCAPVISEYFSRYRNILVSSVRCDATRAAISSSSHSDRVQQVHT